MNIDNFQSRGTDWRNIKQMYENSVMQIHVIAQMYHPLQPYAGGSEKMTSGSSFLIDKKRAIFATSAHGVVDASSLTGSLPKYGKLKIPLELVSIIKDKDLALVRIEPKFAKEFMKDPEIREMKIGDNFMVENTQDVLAIGYPHGERTIKYSSGIISGLHNDETGFFSYKGEDSYNRESSYITITAPLNPGVSGGPLVDSSGRVIGINSAGRMDSQNIGFSIGIRTFLANYNSMLEETFPKIPTFNMRWANLDQDTCNYLSKRKLKRSDGVLLRKVLPDSVFTELHDKDILYKISFNIVKPQEEINLKSFEEGKIQKVSVNAYINNIADITLRYDDGTPVFNRQITFAEVADMIETGEEVNAEFIRDGKFYNLTTPYKHIDSARIHGIFPHFQKFDYVIAGGMCFTPLLLNQMGYLRKFHFIGESGLADEFMFKPKIVLTQVFDNTKAHESEVFQAGDILEEVNGHKIKTLEDIEKAVKNTKNEYVTFKMDNGSFLAVNIKRLKHDDKIVKEYI